VIFCALKALSGHKNYNRIQHREQWMLAALSSSRKMAALRQSDFHSEETKRRAFLGPNINLFDLHFITSRRRAASDLIDLLRTTKSSK